MKSRSVRWWLSEVVVPAGFVVALASLPLAVWDRLPDSIARHWDASGVSNGWSPKGPFVILMVVLGIVAWSSMLTATIRGSGSKALTATIYFVFGTLLGATAYTVWANLDLEADEVAATVGVLHVGALIGGATVIGAIGWFLSDSEADIGSKTSSDELLTIDLDPAESAVWLGSSSSLFFTPLAGLFVAAAVVLRDVTSVVFVIVALLMFMFSASRVSVTSVGVVVGAGPWGWPNKVVPLSEVARAESLYVEPMAFGGWGLRLKGVGDDRASAFIVRKGEGMRLVRPHQSDIVVTVDSPDGGVGLINALLALRSEEKISEGKE